MASDAHPGHAPPRQRLTRAQSRQQTRERLLAAAADLFAEQGVTGASVEQIAERAGYSRGAFYSNFADKDALVLELLKQRTLREVEEVRALRQAAGSFADVLERLRAWNTARTWNTARAQHPESWLALRLELILHAIRTPRLRPLLAERELLGRRAIAAGIQHELRQAGSAPPADTAFLALIVHALEDGLLIQRLLTPDEISDAVVVDAVALLMHAWAVLGRSGEASAETA